MPEFEITSPDGRKFRVKAPEGASKQDALDRVRAKYASEKISGQDSDKDPLAYRGSILPLGRTKEGNIIPTIPEPIVEGARLVKGALTKGQLATPEEALGPASLGVGGSPAIRGGRGALGKIGPKPEVPTTEGLGAAKTGAYAASESAGDAIKPEALKGFVLSLLPGLKDAGINKGMHPKAWALLEHMRNEAGLGPRTKIDPHSLEALMGGRTPDQPITLKEFDDLRQLARENITPTTPGKEVRINQIIIEKVDDFIMGLDDQHLTAGGTREGRENLLRARELSLRESKAKEIDQVFKLSETKAGEQRASGMENAWRNEFKAIYNREIKKSKSKYSQEELEGLKEAATTGNMQKGLVTLGKLSPTAGVVGFLSLATMNEIHHFVQRPWLLGIPAGMFVARYAATKMRENSVKTVEELIKGGRPISDYRFQQALRTRGRFAPSQLGAMGGAGFLPKPQPQQPDQFNPLLNPGAT